MKKKNNVKKLQIVLIVVAVVCVILAVGFCIVGQKKEAKEAVTSGGNVQEAEDSTTITYEGKKYKYNRDLKNIVFFGVDKRNTVQVQQYPGRGGQSDAVMVLSMNKETKTMKVLQVSRDSMINLKIYDGDGNFLAEERGQLALQYAYGDGEKKSCRLSRDAVSELLYGIPMSGYISLNMDGIVSIVDALGGVPMTFAEDYSYVDPAYTQGASVVLDGSAAERFVRYRDVKELGSNNIRMARQIDFMNAMLNEVTSYIQSESGYEVLLNSASPYMVTDLKADEMKDLSHYKKEEPMYKVPGVTVPGEEHDEYQVDEEALREMIIDLFYIPA